MQMEEFPSCCGIGILTDFFEPDEIWMEFENGEWGYGKPTEKDRINELRDELLATKGNNRAWVIGVTSDKKQQVRSAKLLAKFGFKKLKQVRNPRTRRLLTMWIYIIKDVTKTQIRQKAKELCALAKK